MMNIKTIKLYKTIRTLAIAGVLLATGSCKDDNILSDRDYTVSGMDVTITVPVELPEMEVKTRADIPDGDLNHVESLWIATFNSTSGAMTTNGWKKVTENLPSEDIHNLKSVELETKSGPSYIVAVANVDNLGVLKSKPTEEKRLSELLEAVTDWPSFLDIAVVSPSTQQLVDRPNTPLPMAGAYTNIKIGSPHDPETPLDRWQVENFKSYTIPYSNSGKISMSEEGGAIHLRRLVSQIKFNLIPGQTTINGTTVDMKLTPLSYKIYNVPKYSWLYERQGELKDKIRNFGANFADSECTAENIANYYINTGEYTSNNMLESTEEGAKAGTFTFSFWQGENKHTSLEGQTVDNYNQRDLEKKESIVAEGVTSDKYEQTESNTGLYTSLTGDTWTPNNMATYVEISCSVDYESEIAINDNGETGTEGPNENAHRTGNAKFIVHLGYMNNVASDFNCYRNAKYTYNLTVNGVNDIRVEAFHGNETPSVEGIVADVTDGFKDLDCHYCVYNIKLSDEELTKFDFETGKGFGFILTTYDNTAEGGSEKTYSEDNFRNKTFDDLSDQEKKYVDWIELMPTTDENVLALYKPRGANSTTFNLVDVVKGLREDQKSKGGWYTLFVKEYTYEADGQNESVFVNGKPIWYSYVFASPRRYYIRVTKAVSSDGQSIYARSKYAGVQQSIASYYDNESIPRSTEDEKVQGSAIGVEHFNESFGLNLRYSFKNIATDRNNGRYNCWKYTRYNYNNDSWSEGSNHHWNYFLNPDKPQTIKKIDKYGVNYEGGTMPLPKIYNYRPSDKKANQYSPQYDGVEDSDYIEAISACLNRNRDNNGDGIIDKSEMRWYVPAIGKYLRLLIGQSALAPDQIVDYNNIPNRPTEFSSNDFWGEYLFFSSEGNELWTMEGMSTSNFNHWTDNSPVAPWQVRCIRNLGTNLNEFHVNKDPIIPAYTFIPKDASNPKKGGRVEMSYFQSTTMRNNAFTGGNGTNANQMPVHTIAEEYNSIYRYGFEIHDSSTATDANKTYDGTMTASDTPTRSYQGTTYYSAWYWENMINYINTNPTDHNNPCTQLNTGTETGWRLPNLKELAIMRNLEVIDYANQGPFLSCSMGVIASKEGQHLNNVYQYPTTDGTTNRYSNGSVNNNNIHNFMIVVQGGTITQKWDQDTYRIRCVRDYTGSN